MKINTLCMSRDLVVIAVFIYICVCMCGYVCEYFYYLCIHRTQHEFVEIFEILNCVHEKCECSFFLCFPRKYKYTHKKKEQHKM